MRLLEFKCIKSNDEDMIGNHENFVEFETDEERETYHLWQEGWRDPRLVVASRAYFEGCWDGYMSRALGKRVSDGTIYYYFENEPVPEVGGTWEQDGDVWERIA